jgi:hypothetical protein
MSPLYGPVIRCRIPYRRGVYNPVLRLPDKCDQGRHNATDVDRIDRLNVLHTFSKHRWSSLLVNVGHIRWYGTVTAPNRTVPVAPHLLTVDGREVYGRNRLRYGEQP